MCWRVLFLFGGVTHSLQWDATFVRQGLGCLLLKSAARQLSMVTAGEVEESVRYGLLAALDRVFRGMDELEVKLILHVALDSMFGGLPHSRMKGTACSC